MLAFLDSISVRWERIPSRGLVVFGIYLFLTLLLYGVALPVFFLSDDFVLLKHVRSIGPWSSMLHQFPDGFYRPLAAISLWFDFLLYGYRPMGFHATNLVLHATTAFVLWSLIRTIDPSINNAWAFLAGLIFLGWQTHAEAVCWISGRFDILCALFYLLALHRYLHHLRSGRATPLVAAILLLFLSLLAKEMALSFFLLALFTRYHFGDRRLKGMLRDGIIFGAVAFMYLFARSHAIDGIVGGYATTANGDLFRYPLNGLKLVFRSLFPPNPLLWYSQPIATKMLLTMDFYGSLITVGCVLFWILRLHPRTLMEIAREGKLLSFAAFSFVFSLLPVLPLGVSIIDTSSERYLYLPAAFLIMVVMSILSRCIPLRAYVVTGVLISFNLAVAVFHIASWRTAGDYCESAIRHIPSVPPGTSLYLLNTPDSYRGSYILRNGLTEALESFRPDVRASSVISAAFVSLRALDDSLRLGKDESGIVVQCGQHAVFRAESDEAPGSIPLPPAHVSPLSKTSYRFIPGRDSLRGMRLGVVTPEGVRVVLPH